MRQTFLRSLRGEVIASLAIHLFFFGAVVVVGQTLRPQREAVVVYLSGEMPQTGPGLSSGEAAPKKNRAGKQTGREKAAADAARRKKKPEAIEKTTAPAEVAENDGKERDRRTPGAEAAGGSWDGDDAIAGNGGFGGNGGRGDGPRGGGQGNSGGLRTRYLREHFAYIRNLIMKHLTYPETAKRMGWNGKVVIAFMIRENGTVENARVISSSGHRVLDSNAIRTVREVEPFPSPPVKAEVVIPIVYKLE